MKALKIGVIGCGAIGKEHIKRLQQRIQGATVVGVSDVDGLSAQTAAQIAGEQCQVYPDIPSLVRDERIDAVVVTSPGFAHKDAVLEAVKAGKPVFCEKPLATTAADCLAIVEAEVAQGRKLTQVGFMRRYDKGYQQLKALIESGAYGQPLLAKCTHRNPTVDESYSTQMAVNDTAIHEIDCMHWLLADDWESVQVMFGKTTVHAHAKLQDPQVMIFKSRNGLIVMLEVFVNCRFGYDINCEVVCEDGVLHLPSPAYPLIRQDGYLRTAIEQSWINRFIDAYDVELQDWVDGIFANCMNGPSAWDGYMAAVTSDALIRSQSSGLVEKVTMVPRPSLYQ